VTLCKVISAYTNRGKATSRKCNSGRKSPVERDRSSYSEKDCVRFEVLAAITMNENNE
jgi:hypothetical protein